MKRPTVCMRRRWGGLRVCAAVLVLMWTAGRAAAGGAMVGDFEAEALFVLRVQPLLSARCMACHGDDEMKIEGGLDMRSREGLLRGGESGEPSIVPGDAEASPMYRAVKWRDEDLRMPPKENERLTEEEVELLRRWIEAGAPWVEVSAEQRAEWAVAAGDGVLMKTSGGLTPDWTYRLYEPESVWAFRPVGKVRVPEAFARGSDNPIDAFVNRKLAEAGLEPAGRADRRVLIRRVSYDLTGLPPTPEEVGAFVRDGSPDAWAKLVDRLLASPHYGQRWAQHWLDVTRYADSAGFANDWERPHAWRYRDYVIRSFNEDKPFDRFVIEQIAGDELDGGDPEMLIAAGFLRMGPWEHTGMSVAAVTRQQWLDDVVNGVGQTFLGINMSCFKCHDHKFDPLPTRDYYRMQAVFAPAQFAERRAPFLEEETIPGFERRRARAQRRIETGSRIIARDAESDGVRRNEEKREGYLRRAAERYEPRAMSVYNGSLRVANSNKLNHDVPEDRGGEAMPVHILMGGALESPGERVEPGVLSALVMNNGPTGDEMRVDIPRGIDGRRLALAEWIASERHPLTARVIVNRIWQHHFAGKGIVGTPNNFGVMGERPTHPELLDWLARWFMDHGWSIKALHRLILTSDAYRRASTHHYMEAVREADPNNDLLAYYPPRRLTAEELRDSMLAVTGELNPAMGGPPVFPEINLEAALQPIHIMGATAPAYQPSPTPELRHRRTIYAFRRRGRPDPMLEVFNRPNPDISCERRDETTVTPQVFSLFNGQRTHDRALALAARLRRHSDELRRQVERAFEVVYGRGPTTEQLEAAVLHVRRMTAHHQQREPTPVRPPSVVRRTMIEEVTGEPFVWEEELDVYTEGGFAADLKPWEVDAATRALAELCLVLFNSNEFLYVY